MKKILIVLALVIIIIIYKNDNIIIPIDSIRVRIISNSNSVNDLNEKLKLKNNIEDYLYDLVNKSNNINEARYIINSNLNNINSKIKSNYSGEYNIKYGLNYFPEKIYRGVKYNSGMYESLVITLGNGMGDNWWCVLFPPLCFIDKNTNDDIVYKSLVSELLKN